MALLTPARISSAFIERLREHVGVDRWLVLGMSWGSTLALAYAERFPERVSEIVLAPVTLTRRKDVDWFCPGVRAFFPAEWERFRDGARAADRDGDLASAYARLLADTDPAVGERAARDWCRWEDAVVSIETAGKPNPRYDDPHFRFGFARLVTHYWSNGAWLTDDELMAGAHRLHAIPGVLIRGQLDPGGPVGIAWELAKAWPSSELIVVGSGGHWSTSLGDRVVAATDRFAAPPNSPIDTAAVACRAERQRRRPTCRACQTPKTWTKKLSQYLGEGLGWLVANVSLVDITSAREVSGGGVCVEGSRRAVGGREAVAAGASA